MSTLGIGTLTGIIVGLILSIVIIKVCNKNGRIKSEYDERQEAIRGRGYKYSMYVTWVSLCIAMLLELGDVDMHMEDSIKFFTIIFIGILVSISYFIWKDAYFGNNNNIKKYLVFFIVITAINALAGIMAIVEHELVVDGVLTFRAINFECALVFIIFGIEYAVKALVVKSDDSEEE